MKVSTAILSAGTALLVAMAAAAAIAQIAAPPPVTANAAPADARTEELIFSRMVMMDLIDLYMGEVEAFSATAVRDSTPVAVEAAEAADIVSVLLLAFPHMFPPGSDIWSEELEAIDPTTVTRALPNLWADYEAFYGLAKAASEHAVQMSRLNPRDQRFIDAAAELRVMCDSCHETFTRPFRPAEPPLG